MKIAGRVVTLPWRRKPPLTLPRWCWRAAVAENSCACQDGCELPGEDRLSELVQRPAPPRSGRSPG